MVGYWMDIGTTIRKDLSLSMAHYHLQNLEEAVNRIKKDVTVTANVSAKR